MGQARGRVAVWAVQVVSMVVLGREQYLFRRARGDLFRLLCSGVRGGEGMQGWAATPIGDWWLAAVV